MLQKFKITTCAFILCLFGLTLITVSPVFAEDSPEFIACQQMKGKKAKKNCFRDLARENEESMQTAFNSCKDRLYNIDKIMRRSCDGPLDERVDQIRGQVCVDGYRWHNNYEDERTTEVINECIPISEEANIDGCSSALTALKAEVKRFNTGTHSRGQGGGTNTRNLLFKRWMPIWFRQWHVVGTSWAVGLQKL